MRGGNPTGLRAYNERLVISAILDAGALSKAQLARRTGLSPNAAMMIANRLIDAGLLRKGRRGKGQHLQDGEDGPGAHRGQRGQRGQPATPITVNPSAAFALGVHIGRSRVQSLLIDLNCGIVGVRESAHDHPDPGMAVDTALRQCRRLLGELDPDELDRVAGLGIALPGQLHDWAGELGLKPGALDGWKDKDVRGILGKSTGLETTLLNDASAACAAELMTGDAITKSSALYLFFGTFIGGAVVIGGRLCPGAQSNAGAIGSMPIGNGLIGEAGSQDQLVHHASLLQLERLMLDHGVDPQQALAGHGGEKARDVFRLWMDRAAPAVARAIVSALSVIDFETVVIDGEFSPPWRRELNARVTAEIHRLNCAGLEQPMMSTGSVGPKAPLIGAAMMPLRARFSPDPELVVPRLTSGHGGGGPRAP